MTTIFLQSQVSGVLDFQEAFSLLFCFFAGLPCGAIILLLIVVVFALSQAKRQKEPKWQ